MYKVELILPARSISQEQDAEPEDGNERERREIAANVTWDYIIKHPLYVRGSVDMNNVSDRFKKVAKSDGQGPVFEETAISDPIE